MKFYAFAILLLAGGLLAANKKKQNIKTKNKSWGERIKDALNSLLSIDFKSLLSKFNIDLPVEELVTLKDALLGNEGIKGELVNGGVKITDVMDSLVCTLKTVGLDAVNQLLSMAGNSLQLFELNKVCSSDKDLFNLITSHLGVLSKPALRDVLCLFQKNISSSIHVVGIQNVETFVSGVCSEGSIAGLLEQYAKSFTPALVKMVVDTVGLAGVDVGAILNLLAATGIKDVDDLKALLLKLKCLLKTLPLGEVAKLIKSMTHSLLTKLAPQLCSSVKLNDMVVDVLSGDNWLKSRTLLLVGGNINVIALQQMVCLAKRFGVQEAVGMDVTMLYKLFCKGEEPLFTLFDDVKLHCYKDFSAKCVKQIHRIVTQDKCKACHTGGGCSVLKGHLPSAVLAKCNAECVTCKSR